MPQTRHEWVKKTEVDTGKRGGVPTEGGDKVKALEREVPKLRQANQILGKVSAYFVQAETRPPVSAMIAFDVMVWTVPAPA